MRNIDEHTITPAFLERLAGCGDARLKEVLSALVRHLHAFAREVRLTEPEWLAGIEFLTATGANVPTLDEAGHMNGILLVAVAAHRERVQRFIDDDPYSRGGLSPRSASAPGTGASAIKECKHDRQGGSHRD